MPPKKTRTPLDKPHFSSLAPGGRCPEEELGSVVDDGSVSIGVGSDATRFTPALRDTDLLYVTDPGATADKPHICNRKRRSSTVGSRPHGVRFVCVMGTGVEEYYPSDTESKSSEVDGGGGDEDPHGGSDAESSHYDVLSGTEDEHEHEHGHGHGHEKHEKWYYKGLFQKPRILKDWGQNPGTGEEEERDVSWAELFFDLVYVTAIGKLGDSLRGEHGKEALSIGGYILSFLFLWRMWQTCCLYATRFNSDDLTNRLSFTALMVAVVGMAMHVPGGYEGSNANGFAASVILFILILNWMMARCAYYIPRYRLEYRMYPVWDVATVSLLIGSMFSPTNHVRLFLWTTALISDYLKSIAPFVFVYFSQPGTFTGKFLPLHLGHFVERFGLFIIIVLGEGVNGISVDPRGGGANNVPLYIQGAASLFMVAALKLLYYDVSETTLDDHALRRNSKMGFLWTRLHGPLACAIAASGSGIALLCDRSQLSEVEQEEEGAFIRDRGRWLLAGGTAISVFLITITKLAHRHPPRERKLDFNMFWFQIIAQLLGAACMSFLPTIHSLRDMELGIAVMGIVILLVALNFREDAIEAKVHFIEHHAHEHAEHEHAEHGDHATEKTPLVSR